MTNGKSAGTRAFVAGDPIDHSRSPLIHRHWLARYGIEGSYERLAVPAERLADLVADLKNGSLGFAGGNITLPHKQAIFALADRVDETARLIGAVNTVWVEDGLLCATNTDTHGFAANLDQIAPGWDEGGTATVLGAGGASRAVLHALFSRGFSEIRLVNRTLGRARELADRFDAPIRPLPIEELQPALSNAGLFVNTSSLGMKASAAPVLDFSAMRVGALVTDVVYAPLETPILAQAREQGMRTADGLGMLLHQAVLGFEIWFGRRPEVTEELRAEIVADLEGAR